MNLKPKHSNETNSQCIAVEIDDVLIRHGLPHNPIIDLINTLSLTYDIFIVTNRLENRRAATEAWLKRYLYDYKGLYMTSVNDLRDGKIIKEEIYNRLKEKFCIVATINND